MKKWYVFLLFCLLFNGCNGSSNKSGVETEKTLPENNEPLENDNPKIPGTLKWKYQTDYQYQIYSPAISDDGTVYFGSWDDNVITSSGGISIYLITSHNSFYALKSDGSLKNKISVGAIYSAPALDSNGVIHFGSSNGNLYRIVDYNYYFDPEWVYSFGDGWGNNYGSSAAVASDGTIYAGSDDSLYAINPNGTNKWKYKVTNGNFRSSSPAIGSNGCIYIGDSNGGLYALNSDGNLKWKSTDINIPDDSSMAIDSNGNILIGAQYVDMGNNNIQLLNALYSIDSSNGTVIWKYKTEGIVNASPSIGENGTIYASSQDGNLYALDNNGSLKWKYQTGYRVYSSPAIGADGIIYVGSSKRLTAINHDGTVRWQYNNDKLNYKSSPAIASDGTIYIGATDGTIHAIYSESQGLANSVWPKFQRDNKNSAEMK